MSFTGVIEAAPDGEAHRYFVASSVTGVFWLVRFTPGEALTCTCPHGARIAAAGNRVPSPRPCRHLREVAAFVQGQVAA